MKIRITNKQRFTRALIVGALIGVMIASVHAEWVDDFAVKGQKRVVAEAGDTVWSLIKRHNDPAVLAQGDMREIVDYFEDMNPQYDGHLTVADVVVIPVVVVNE